MVEWIVSTMERLEYGGIAFLMFMENLFPPIPSELIMPLAGFTASKGRLNFQYAVLAGVVGTIAGTLVWYYAGVLMGEKRLRTLANRYGKWCGMSGADIDRANRWFARHGAITVLVCRLIPGIRTLISLPAGISQMPLALFLFYSTIGTTVWIFALTYAGYFLGDHYTLVEAYLGSVSKIVLTTLGGGLIAWIVWRNRTQNAK